MSTLLGLPEIKDPEGASVIKLSQAHGRVDLEHAADDLRIGDKVELWVSDANHTINLYDRFCGLRDDFVKAVWGMPAVGHRS